MKPKAAPPATDQLFFTALPNGILGSELRLSLLMTPSLVTTPIGYPFTNWPDYAKTLHFSATFTDPAHNHAVMSGPTPLTIDPASVCPVRPKSLWLEIFGGTSGVAQRTGHRALHRSWRISHDISSIHTLNAVNRLAHAYHQVVANRQIASQDAVALPAQTAPPPLFLHPDFNTGTPSDLPQRIADRATALKALGLISATLPQSTHKWLNYMSIVTDRFNYGIATLEKWGDAHLTAASLSALYILCLQRATPAGTIDPVLNAAITQVSGWFSATLPSPFKASYPEYVNIPAYLELVLFHHRSTTKPISGPIKQPDFHQLLGLVHNYPAIMRQLNLVYDFVLPRPNLTGPYAVSIALDPPTHSNLLPGAGIVSPVTVVSCNTRCTLMPGQFLATPSDPKLIQAGLLNLQVADANLVPRFSLVAENADGQALKTTSQANNLARGVKYTTSAPTAYNAPSAQDLTVGASVPTPSANANPVIPPPAPRTVGLALFDRLRLAGLEARAANTPDADGSPAPLSDFFAEDITLGYRVDVLYKSTFYSLGTRNSCYGIYTPRSNPPTPVDNWVPVTDMEKSADEGFTSFGATQTPMVDQGTVDDATDTQTQVHQSVFTWTGWSLSVPAPNFPQMNRKTTPSDDPSSHHLAIRPIYSVSKGQLPPLRFNTDYKIRCRLVDLAGNGQLPTLDPHNSLYDQYTAKPFTQFSRHEPIRAPQFLLREPIDRRRQPGTHIDRMVARDNDGPSSRMLAPPRESLRLAELSGFLKSDKLPETAFGDRQLEIDGAFPSVARAKELGLVPGTPDNPHDNDPIFLPRTIEQVIENRYYPDPLANFIRVQAFVVSDNPAVSQALDPFWLKIADGQWPHRLAARVHLAPTDQDIYPTIVPKDLKLENELGFKIAPTVLVTLPKAYTVILRISSAAVDHDSPAEEVSACAVHLTHLAARHKNDPSVFDALLPPHERSGNAVPPTSAGNRLARLGASIAQDSASSPALFIDGGLDIGTPKRSLTLIHAVKVPLAPPAFSPAGLTVIRALGKPEASVIGQLSAHWRSTAKITCYAVWSDRVDDLKLPVELKTPVPHREVAFTITLKDLTPDGLSGPTRLRTLPASLLHHFTDTRAHAVKYSLVATSNFREYYPGADKQPDPDADRYRIKLKDPFETVVASSARPLAPSLVYVIPAFIWTDSYDKDKKTWGQERLVVLRAYFERPFLLSGDLETVAVVLVDPNSSTAPASQSFVSRWGADPTRDITNPILQNELTDANLNEPGLPIETAYLAEGGSARFKPCKIQYSCERRLWFADIPIDTQNANAPFVRLGLVRWQSQSLMGSVTDEARCSQVIFAEFMQISPNRWASIERKSGSFYRLALSGAFPSKNPVCPFNVTLQKRWYPLGQDTGWRTIDWSPDFPPPTFEYHPPTDSSGVSSWTVDLHTPHSAYDAKYRVFLTEDEIPGQTRRRSLSMFVPLP